MFGYRKKDMSNGTMPLHRQKGFGTYVNTVLAMFSIAIGLLIQGGLNDAVLGYTKLAQWGWFDIVDLTETLANTYGSRPVTVWFITVGYAFVWLIILSWFISNIRDFFALFSELRANAKEAARIAAKETGVLIEEELTWVQRFWNWSIGYRLKVWQQRAKKRRLEAQARMDEQLAKLEAEVAKAEAIADGTYVEPEESDEPKSLFEEE